MTTALMTAVLCLSGACASYPLSEVQLPPNTAALVDAGRVASGFEQAAPHYRNGHRRGLALRKVEVGSLVHQLGLRAGDVIREFDGYDCNALLACRAGADQMNRALRLREEFDLLIERDGALHRFRYSHTVFEPLRP